MKRNKVIHRSCLILTFLFIFCILSCLSPSFSLFADIDHDEEIPEESAAAREAERQYTSAYNKLTSLMAEGKGDTPEAQAAYKAYKKAKDKYEAILKDEQVVEDSSSSKTLEEQKKEAYQQYISAYNKLNYLINRHEGDTPQARRAYEDYQVKKDRWEAISKTEDTIEDSSSAKTIEEQKMQAYEDYMKAYNHFTSLISQGKKGTVEAADSFKEYQAKKAQYEKLLKEAAGPTEEKPSSLQEAYDKYLATYDHLTKLVVETRITGPPEIKKLSERYREARDEYNRTQDRRAYQESIAIYNQLTSQSIKIEFTGPDNLRHAQQDYFNAKTEYDRLVKQSK